MSLGTPLAVNPIVRTVFFGLAASVPATMAKTKAEGVLQPVAEKMAPPAPAHKIRSGADPADHPEKMPPSELADRVQRAVTGDELSDDARQKVAAPLHWGMGVGFGTAYALVAARVPAVRAGYGTAAAAALFAATHLTSLPAVGVQDPPARMPAAWWVWEFGSHLCYGVVLDRSLRALEYGAAFATKR